MQSMTTTDGMDEQQARQLLGTLSRNRDDIRAAYLHHYRACALELSRADTQVQQQQLESELARLRSAQSVLLGEKPTGTATGAPSSTTVRLAAPNSEHPAAESRQPPTPVTTQVLLSSTLVVLLCAVTLLSAFLWQQGDQLQQLEQQLSQQQQRYQTLSQHAQHQDQRLSQTLQQHDEQQQQWLNHLSRQQQLQQQQQTYIGQQQQQMEQQLALIQQQQQLSQTLHQRLASVDRQLSVEHQQTLRLQQQVARLNQQSDVLIDELCQDTASAQPAIDDVMVPAYMNRCRLLWSLASD